MLEQIVFKIQFGMLLHAGEKQVVFSSHMHFKRATFAYAFLRTRSRRSRRRRRSRRLLRKFTVNLTIVRKFTVNLSEGGGRGRGRDERRT